MNVSIIVPIFNMEKYLRDCLDTIMNQTLDSFEVILVDDGSNDASPEIIREYQQRYPQLIRSFTKENGGQATARNLGIRESKGEYIGFVDADDTVDLKMYEQMYSLAKEKDLDLVECAYRFVKIENNREVELKTYGHVRKYTSQRDMFIDSLVSPWNKLYRGDILRGNGIDFPEGYIYEDTAFFVKAIPYIKTWDYIDEPFVKHFQRANSTMTGNRSLRVANIFPVLEDIWKYYDKIGKVQEYMEELKFFTAKILLCSSLDRISMVEENNIRKDLLRQTCAFLKKYAPDYRKNAYVRANSKGLYMRLIYPWNIGMICTLLSLRQRG